MKTYEGLADWEKQLEDGMKAYAAKLDKLAEKNDWEEWAEFFETISNVNYTVDRYGRLQDVTVWLGIGGPTYYIDTEHCQVVGYWASDKHYYPLKGDTVDKIFDYWEGEYECLRQCDYRRIAY